VMVQVLSIR